MLTFIKKPYRFAILYTFLLIGALSYVLLDTFVITKTIATVDESQLATQKETETGEITITTTTYEDDHIKISIQTMREYDTTFYVADIQVSDISYLKTALANDSYGRNIKETTSAMAEDKKAIFAINGDYYGFRNFGFVVRNGVVYRDTSNSAEALVIDENGDFRVIDEDSSNVNDLFEENVWQVFSFGPTLIIDSQIVVNASSEVAQSMTSNPRTAIGQIDELHYIVIVSDGRTDESEGLTLLELAEQFEKYGCSIAYNLDGGGSSTMYFNGEIINNPSNGRSEKEREVSDIVYIGY